MILSSVLLENAVDQLATLPGIGRRTAMRLGLGPLASRTAGGGTLQRGHPAYARGGALLRGVLQHQRRGRAVRSAAIPTAMQALICVVEDIRDVIAIENTRQFKGLYHVLGGVISPMDGIGPDDLNTQRALGPRAAAAACAK